MRNYYRVTNKTQRDVLDARAIKTQRREIRVTNKIQRDVLDARAMVPLVFHSHAWASDAVRGSTHTAHSNPTPAAVRAQIHS